VEVTPLPRAPNIAATPAASGSRNRFIRRKSQPTGPLRNRRVYKTAREKHAVAGGDTSSTLVTMPRPQLVLP